MNKFSYREKKKIPFLYLVIAIFSIGIFLGAGIMLATVIDEGAFKECPDDPGLVVQGKGGEIKIEIKKEIIAFKGGYKNSERESI